MISYQWYHVAATYNGSTVQYYVNGMPAGSATPGNVDAIKILRIGGWGTGDSEHFGGKIDEVRVSNTARTADEIAEAYRAGRDHRIGRGFASTDLSGKSKLPFYIASDRPGTFMEATIGESGFANYEPDANTVGLCI